MKCDADLFGSSPQFGQLRQPTMEALGGSQGFGHKKYYRISVYLRWRFFWQNRRQAKWNEAKTFTDDCVEHIPLPYAGQNKT